MNTDPLDFLSTVIRRYSWFLPFLIGGSVATCALPWVFAYQPMSVIKMFLLGYVALLVFCAVVVVGIGLSIFLKGVKHGNRT
jgi:hypothetical protein